MVVASENPLFIHLDIPSSPLLLSLSSEANSPLNASVLPAPSCSTLSPEMIHSVSSSSTNSSFMLQPSHPVPEITITSPLSGSSLNEPPISPPPCDPPRPRARITASASKKLIDFIDFLEKVDRDMAAEIEHVRESIREAREYVGEWQEERSARRAELLKKRERERRETKRPGSDFWLGI
ncbi:hypothetical protein BJV74DRAFT_820262 [Russula compacta]|nr:hypothetical protein BJV74DRAFT_820262 [Russula compacta]